MNPGPAADLHTHTNCSDGALSPPELVAAALEIGLAAVAVTDHDSFDGVRPAQRAAEGTPLEIIPGVEVAVLCDGQELHLVALFVDPHNRPLRDRIVQFRTDRVKRIHEIVSRLRRTGLELTSQEVFQAAGNGAPGRPHVAHVLQQRGLVPDLAAAFHRYIGVGRPGYVPRDRPSPADAIPLLRQAGAVVTWAHPGLTARDELLPQLVRHGLQAVEAFCPVHSAADTERYLALAHRHDLAVSGGSDFHQDAPGSPPLGCACLPLEYLQQLRERSQNARCKS